MFVCVQVCMHMCMFANAGPKSIIPVVPPMLFIGREVMGLSSE